MSEALLYRTRVSLHPHALALPEAAKKAAPARERLDVAFHPSAEHMPCSGRQAQMFAAAPHGASRNRSAVAYTIPLSYAGITQIRF
jgi:hypothetical protein